MQKVQVVCRLVGNGAFIGDGHQRRRAQVRVISSRWLSLPRAFRSRVISSPTPVSVVGATALLEAPANADVGDTLRQMPSMGTIRLRKKASSSNAGQTWRSGTSAASIFAIWGATRNLVLFDNQRVVGSALTSGVDLSIIPSSIVQRVDVVTAGASAAWGSGRDLRRHQHHRQQELQRPEGLRSTSRTLDRTPAAATASR